MSIPAYEAVAQLHAEVELPPGLQTVWFVELLKEKQIENNSGHGEDERHGISLRLVSAEPVLFEHIIVGELQVRGSDGEIHRHATIETVTIVYVSKMQKNGLLDLGV